jgi:hypothetical protein
VKKKIGGNIGRWMGKATNKAALLINERWMVKDRHAAWFEATAGELADTYVIIDSPFC